MNTPADLLRYFIPTRDSSKYVLTFFDCYRAAGIFPLYIVDGRSADNTYDLLTSRGADVHIVHPQGAFGVTELVAAACQIAQTQWVFRLDDDEFPSNELTTFISDYVANSGNESKGKLCINREWITTYEGQYVFFRSSRRKAGVHYDGQFRLFHNSMLKFEHHIHTPGISTPDLPVIAAPADCFLVHFDAILKDTQQKLSKMRKYEDLEPGSAWVYADLYLPELFHGSAAYSHHRHSIEQFLSLAQKLPSVVSALPELRSEEFQAVASLGIPGLKPVK